MFHHIPPLFSAGGCNLKIEAAAINGHSRPLRDKCPELRPSPPAKRARPQPLPSHVMATWRQRDGSFGGIPPM
jgi:hypothetical protein